MSDDTLGETATGSVDANVKQTIDHLKAGKVPRSLTQEIHDVSKRALDGQNLDRAFNSKAGSYT